MGTENRPPKPAPLKRLNEYLQTYGLSFSDALNVALFLLTIFSLILAGAGVYLAKVQLDAATQAAKDQDDQFHQQIHHQDDQFSEQKKQLDYSAALLAKQSDTLTKQLQIAQSIYDAHPIPEIALRCNEMNTHVYLTEDIKISTEKAAEGHIDMGILHDYDHDNLVICDFIVSNRGTQELHDAELSVSNISPLCVQNGKPCDLLHLRSSQPYLGVTYLHDRLGGKAKSLFEPLTLDIGDVPEWEKTETPCKKCRGDFNLHVSRDAVFTTVTVMLTSSNSPRLRYSLRTTFDRKPAPSSAALEAASPPNFSPEAVADLPKDVPFVAESYTGGVTVLDNRETNRTIRLNWFDGYDWVGYAEVEIGGEIRLGKQGLLGDTDSFQRLRFLNNDNWHDIVRKSVNNGRLFIWVSGEPGPYTIHDIKGPGCPVNSNGLITCVVSGQITGVIEDGIKTP